MIRDRWGRPYVSNDGGPLKFVKGKATPVNAEGYTRVSTLAGTLDDKSGILEWSAANAMIGMIKDPSIAAQVGSLASKYDCLLYTSPSPRDKRQSRMPSSA